MHVADYLGHVAENERLFADALHLLADRHASNPELRDTARLLASWSEEASATFGPLFERYGKGTMAEPKRVAGALFRGARLGGFGLLRDLQDVALLAYDLQLGWTALAKAASLLEDVDFEERCEAQMARVERQVAWVKQHHKVAAPQALVVPPAKKEMLKASVPKNPAAVLRDRVRLRSASARGAALLAAAGVMALVAVRLR